VGVRRELSGGGGAADSHGHFGVFGCKFQPTPHGEGREELNSPAGAVRPQDGEASGLDPEVLHVETLSLECSNCGTELPLTSEEEMSK